MVFPAGRALVTNFTFSTVGSAVLAVAILGAVTPPAAGAEPPLRHVKYTVTTEQPFHSDVYYRDVEPPSWAEYSHNPYLYSPKAEVTIGPGQPWILETHLADPDQWAMVAVTNGRSPQTPNYRCELAVDGVVVATDEGPKGALCSIRPW